MNKLFANEKKKWQIALRRYIIEQKNSPKYAVYFGVDIQNFRNWIEQSFREGMNWDNFSTVWQFDFVLNPHYFDFTNDAELKLCWNYLNITTAYIQESFTINTNLLQAEHFYILTDSILDNSVTKAFIEKIKLLKQKEIVQENTKLDFLEKNKATLNFLHNCNDYELNNINTGTPLSEIIAERELLKRFG